MKTIRTFKKILTVSLAFLLISIISGCVSSKEKRIESSQQLNKQEVIGLLAGNTKTEKRDWGRWSHYFKDDSLSGVGSAKGSWGNQKSKSTATVSDDGELCYRFSGGPKWAEPKNEYCEKLYLDKDGTYFMTTTKATGQPEKVGRLLNFEIKKGDHFGLM